MFEPVIQGQAQSEAVRAAPGSSRVSSGALKGRQTATEIPKNAHDFAESLPRYAAPSGREIYVLQIQGRRAQLRFALTPGYLLSRPWRLVSDVSHTVANGSG